MVLTRRLRILTVIVAGLFFALFLNFKMPLADGGWAEATFFFVVASLMYAVVRKGMSAQVLICISLVLSIGVSAVK